VTAHHALISLALACSSLTAHAASPERPTTAAGAPRADSTPAHARGHSHNDYRRPRPLLDALDAGMGSIEADVFPVDAELLVGHDRDELRPGRTLASMYLEPLARLARDEPARIPAGPRGGPFILLVDIKTDADESYAILERLLEPLAFMLTRFEGGAVIEGRVSVILSGARPIDTLREKPRRLAFIDGRLADLDEPAAHLPATLAPLISDSWTARFTWLGVGDMPDAERLRLRDDVRRAHTAGRLIRFWGVPNAEPVWRELLDAGVDLLNNDRPADAAAFIQRHTTGAVRPDETASPRR
jgi:hypothetical protein